ncbi:hypothetical protein RGZ1_202 [Morganella phage vB_MmoM_Rgz1]|nr:hypothetical protein RGZ1_202 [Morganella phage vB_MmoM_Rgz1]
MYLLVCSITDVCEEFIMKKNLPEFIEFMNQDKTEPTAEQKRTHNHILDKNEVICVVEDNKNQLIIFGCKEEDVATCVDVLKNHEYYDKIRDKIDFLNILGPKAESVYHNFKDSYVETSLIKRYPEQVQSVEDFITKNCTKENEVKSDSWEYEDLFRKVLYGILQTEVDNIKEGFRDSGIRFYETWEDTDGKYGLIQYAIMYGGEIIGQLSQSGRWLGDNNVTIYSEPDFFTGLFMKYFITDTSWLSVRTLDNMINEFKTPEFHDKEY